MARTMVEETALATRQETSSELATAASVAAVQQEIQASIIIARKFPRDEDQCFARLMNSCKRTSFAEDAAYSFPRGGANVTGPSVNVAREAARIWGNVRYGLDIIRDDETSRQIRGWAWDVETNTKVTAEDDFRKLIQRKDKKTGVTSWVAPDERDLRELTNRRGAILVRNCILQILPKDLIEDALLKCEATLKSGAEQDPDGARKKIILAFAEISVTPEMLAAKLGHPLQQASPAEIAELRKVWKSIVDGNSTWAEFAPADEKKADAPANGNGKGGERGTLSMDDLKAPAPETKTAPAETKPAEPETKPEAVETAPVEDKCTAAEFEAVELLALDCGISMPEVRKHAKDSMGIRVFSTLPLTRLEEVKAWILANRKR